MLGELLEIPVYKILGPKDPLRSVDKSTPEYHCLRDSLKDHKQFHNICVRPAGARAFGQYEYEVVYGFTRFTAICDLGWPTVLCMVRELTDFEAMCLQTEENAHVNKTSDEDYRRRLVRLTEEKPGISIKELAVIIHKPPQWVGQQMKLLSLDRATLQLVDDGRIPLGSAYLLAKIQPASARTQALVQQAVALPASEFKIIAQAIIKRRMEEIRQGKLNANFAEMPFEPISHARSVKELKHEHETWEQAGMQLTIAKAQTAMDGWKAAIDWAQHLDKTSVDEARRAAEATVKQNLLDLYQKGNHDDLD